MKERKKLLPNPWRNLGEDPWTEEVYQSLKKQIVTHEHVMKCFNVLLLGQISSGKSSFVNTVESVFAEHVTTRANIGCFEDEGLYRTYEVEISDKKNKQIKFKVANGGGGHDVFREKISAKTLRQKTRGGGGYDYDPSPTIIDQIHCVAYVVDAVKFDFMDEDLIDKFKVITKEANQRSLNPIIILTRVDQICDETAKDITNVYLSTVVKEKVQRVSTTFGITENMVYPAQNYSSQTEKNLGIDILNLITLRQILRCSEQFWKDKADRESELRKQPQLGKLSTDTKIEENKGKEEMKFCAEELLNKRMKKFENEYKEGLKKLEKAVSELSDRKRTHTTMSRMSSKFKKTSFPNANLDA